MGKLLLFIIFVMSVMTAADSPECWVYAAKSIEDNPAGLAQDSLTAFSARIKDKEIHLVWKIYDLQNISYFIIDRRDSEHRIFEPINLKDRIKKADYIERSTDENRVTSYKFSYTDEPQRDGVFYYRIRAYNSSGNLLFQSEEIKIGISGIKDFILEQNQPNPFNPITTIKYELFSDTHVNLQVFDLIGREIATLVDQFQTKGKYEVQFDISSHSSLTSGIYFYKLQTELYSDVKKMIVSK